MKTRLAWLLAGCSVVLVVILAVSPARRRAAPGWNPTPEHIKELSKADWSSRPSFDPPLTRHDSMELDLSRMSDDLASIKAWLAQLGAEVRFSGLTGGRGWALVTRSHVDNANWYGVRVWSSAEDGSASCLARAKREAALADSALGEYRQYFRTSDGRTPIRIVPFWVADVKPRVETRPKAEYPAGMPHLEARALVLVRVLIGVTGGCDLVVLLKTSGYPLLDSAALRAARQAKFTPGLFGGEPVRVWIDIPYGFARYQSPCLGVRPESLSGSASFRGF